MRDRGHSTVRNKLSDEESFHRSQPFSTLVDVAEAAILLVRQS